MKKSKAKTKDGVDASANSFRTLLISLDPVHSPTSRSAGMPAKSAVIFLSVLLLAPLLVFLKRPFHIDDPLFIWVARHIQTDPLNPYGFAVNWYGFSMPMSEVTKNPPLASYYIAL